MYRTEHCAGVDEVGRGPLAGAVYAAAVVLDPFRELRGLADSKVLSEAKREALDCEIRREALAVSVARAEVEEIDRLNILNASLLAMSRAVSAISLPLDFVVVDGNRLPDLNVPAEFLVQGDGKYDAIKAASIVAKVARDREMVRLDALYPEYGLAAHKGYPTTEHMKAIHRYGPSPVHRLSFEPCRQRDLFWGQQEHEGD